LCSFYSWIWLRLWVASDRIYAYPVDAGKFVTYEALKDFWRGRKGGEKLSTLETAVGGALASALAQGVSTPLDVVRTRIMTRPPDQPAQDLLECLREIANDEGVASLYTGLTPKTARALVSGAIQFSVLDNVKTRVESLLRGRA
jgi:solute carrier family 25 S-adenosylmethionine transporter 26